MNANDLPEERNATAVWDAHLDRTVEELRGRALAGERRRAGDVTSATGSGQAAQRRLDAQDWRGDPPRPSPERIPELVRAEGDEWLLHLYERVGGDDGRADSG